MKAGYNANSSFVHDINMANSLLLLYFRRLPTKRSSSFGFFDKIGLLIKLCQVLHVGLVQYVGVTY